MLNVNTKTNVTFWFIFCDDNPKYWLFGATKDQVPGILFKIYRASKVAEQVKVLPAKPNLLTLSVFRTHVVGGEHLHEHTCKPRSQAEA